MNFKNKSSRKTNDYSHKSKVHKGFHTIQFLLIKFLICSFILITISLVLFEYYNINGIFSLFDLLLIMDTQFKEISLNSEVAITNKNNNFQSHSNKETYKENNNINRNYFKIISKLNKEIDSNRNFIVSSEYASSIGFNIDNINNYRYNYSIDTDVITYKEKIIDEDYQWHEFPNNDIQIDSNKIKENTLHITGLSKYNLNNTNNSYNIILSKQTKNFKNYKNKIISLSRYFNLFNYSINQVVKNVIFYNKKNNLEKHIKKYRKVGLYDSYYYNFNIKNRIDLNNAYLSQHHNILMILEENKYNITDTNQSNININKILKDVIEVVYPSY